MEHSEPYGLQEDSTLNIRDILMKYLRHWYWFVLGLLIMMTGAWLYLRYTTPLYGIDAALLIKDDKGNAGSGAAGMDGLQGDILGQLTLFGNTANVDNEIAILQSRSLAEKTVKELGLSTTYFIEGRIKRSEIYKQTPLKITPVFLKDTAQKVILNISINRADHLFMISDGKGTVKTPGGEVVNLPSGSFLLQPDKQDTSHINSITVEILPFNAVVESYMHKLSVNASSKASTVLDLSLKETVPQKGKDFLNTLIEKYNEAGLRDKNQNAANTVKFIDGRLDSISGELSGVENQLESFLSSHSIADIDDQSKLFLDQVKDLDQQLGVQQLNANMLQSIETYVSQPEKQHDIVPSSLGIQDPTLLSLIQQYNSMQLARTQQLQSGATVSNPVVKVMDSQISKLRGDIHENVQNLLNGTQLAVGKLEQQNQVFNNKIRSVPAWQRDYIAIKRQQEIKQTLYVYLLQKKEEAAISEASSVYNSRVIDPAQSSPEPVAPKRQLIYLGAFLLGLLIPAGIIYLAEILNNKISSRKEVESLTQAPVFAEISHSDEEGPIIIQPGARSVIAEQFRSLRTNLGFILGTKPDCKVILVTSSMSGEGKSFISLNLAMSYALMGKRTVLLGLDLRNPKLGSYLKLEGQKGISNYLAGQEEVENLAVELSFGQHNLYFINSGPVPPNPAELLLQPRMDKLMDILKKEYDYILLDTPPIGLVTDAQLIGKYADTSLYIVRHNFTMKGQLQLLDSLYREKRLPDPGVVLNDIKAGDSYRYRYGYGYGYGYGYYSENGHDRNIYQKLKKSLNLH